MARKKQPNVVDPVTRGVPVTDTVEIPSFNGRYPDVVRLDPLICSDPPVDRPVVQTGINISMPPNQEPLMVQSGIDIFTGEPIYKPAPPDLVEQWNTPGRKLYQAVEHITGSYNTRFINLNVGTKVYLNEKELAIFKSYVKEVT